MRILILLFCMVITSCSVFSPSLSQNPWINKPMKLTAPRFLSQTRYISWISWSQDIDINTIEWPNEQADCKSHVNDCIPTLKEYLKNMGYWQAWHKNTNGSQYRILGILPVGTEYHFYKIEVPNDLYNNIVIFYALIDNGVYRSTSVYYKYDLKKPIDLWLVQQMK